jgi:signal transduction histidine kinase
MHLPLASRSKKSSGFPNCPIFWLVTNRQARCYTVLNCEDLNESAMNPISAFFVRNIIIVFFFYGLVFFIMGVALLLASRRQSEFHFAQAIRPLAAFGLLHGIHEWYEMYQKYAALTGGYSPAVWEESMRLALLAASFVALLFFGVKLLDGGRAGRWRYLPVAGMVALWGMGTLVVALRFEPAPMETIAVADVLARYSLGIPGTLLGAWALMAQQRTFREHNMPQFGRALVWCAAALLLYGVFGQLFARPTLLFPTQFINSTLFLQWTGIPVQLFRAMMAAAMTFYMVHALRAFEVEDQRRLEQALQAERHQRREVERLNSELRLTARELSLLLTLSNDLATPLGLQDRLTQALSEIVRSLAFPKQGMILLNGREMKVVEVHATVGFTENLGSNKEGNPRYLLARTVGERCIEKGVAVCCHQDGQIIDFTMESLIFGERCQQHLSPTTMLALPLATGQETTGSLVLVRPQEEERPLPIEELELMAAIAHQLALSIENARLTWRAQRHEKLLASLLDQVVDAQEAERQRIARELHDATGQSLTAISLGLRGIGRVVEEQAPAVAASLREIESYSTSALGELRRIIADLRPSQLDDLGLAAALRWYVQAFQARRGITAEFVLHGEAIRLPVETETVLFRITQEALTNVAKHAQATHVTVSLEIQAGAVTVTIADNGAGFEARSVLNGERPYTSGWGLIGIRERARLLGGQCTIDSTPGEGSRISVTIPLAEPSTVKALHPAGMMNQE